MGYGDPPSTTAAYPGQQQQQYAPYAPQQQQYVYADTKDVHVQVDADNYAISMAADDPLDRAVFVRNVYLIVTAQLLIVAAMTAFVYLIEPVREWMVYMGWIFYLPALFFEIFFLCVLFCVRKHKVYGPIALLGFTIASGYMVALICCYYAGTEILEAVIITAGTVIVCVGYATFTKANFKWLYLVIICITFCLFFWQMWFWMWWWMDAEQFQVMWQMYCIMVILLFVCYLLFDTYLITQKYPVDEHLIAAANLYLDIITIFLYILALLGSRK